MFILIDGIKASLSFAFIFRGTQHQIGDYFTEPLRKQTLRELHAVERIVAKYNELTNIAFIPYGRNKRKLIVSVYLPAESSDTHVIHVEPHHRLLYRVELRILTDTKRTSCGGKNYCKIQ